MPICADGDLDKMMKKKRFNNKEATNCLKQIVNGLRELHAINFWHRDMKPGNVMVDGNKFKIMDYGLATVAAQNPTAM